MSIGSNCTLWVNDMADYRPAEHGYGYTQRSMPVEVSFVSRSGRATRAAFDPETGDVEWYELPSEADLVAGR